MRRLWHRYFSFWGSSPDADVDDEIRFHMEMRAAALRREGLSAAAADQTAERLFGDVAAIRGECTTISRRRARRTTRGSDMRGFWSDVRYAARGLVHARAFTIVAVATLALGIGANTVIFSLIDAIVLRPIPGVAAPQRLFDVVSTPLSFPAFRDQQAADAQVADVAAFRARRFAVRSGTGAVMRTVVMVSGNYFATLGARAGRGRLLGVADDARGAQPSVVLSDHYWRTELGGDPSVIGRSIFVSDARATVVGVAAPEFRGTRLASVPDLWIPVSAWSTIRPSGLTNLDVDNRGWGWLQVIGRLHSGVNIAQAQAAVLATAKHAAELYPNVAPAGTLELRPTIAVAAGKDAHQPIVRFMTVLLSVAGMVLLIACLNIANLLLARYTKRRAEITVRAALGATRMRLVRQLASESLLLGLLGAVAAVALTVISVRAMDGATLPGGISLAAIDLRLNPLVLGFGVGLGLITTLVFGLVPAIHGSADAAVELRERDSTGSQRTARLRDVLLVVQVAMSLVLLIGAGLFARGLQRGLSIDLGFRPDHLAIASVNTGLVRYDTVRAERYFEDGLARVKALPGVTDAAWTVTPPLTGHNSLGAVIDGFTPKAGAAREDITVDIVGPRYLEIIGARVLRGRDLTAYDRRAAPPVCVVSAAFARKYWPGENALGKHVIIEDTMTVVGIASNVKTEQLTEDPVPVVYQALAQQPRWLLDEAFIVVRSSGDADALLPSIARGLEAGGAEVPVYGLRSFNDQLGTALFPQRFGTRLLGAFSILALLVSTVGVYGIVGYMVDQRTRELGVRIALGAPITSVYGLVLVHTLARLGLGIVAGLTLAALTTRAAASFLFGVSARDAATYGAGAIVFAVVGLAAAYVPARRAAAVDPVSALR